MAFIFKNRNTKNWLAGFRDATGKRRNRSTGIPTLGMDREETEKNRVDAEKLAREYEVAANRKRTSQQVRRVITELHREITGVDLPVVTVQVHVDEWLKSKVSSVSAGTLAFYTTSTKKFTEFLGDRADGELGDIERRDIEAFRDEMAERLAAKTVNNNLKTLRMLFRDARDRTVLVDDPTEFVKAVKAKTVIKRRPFAVTEVSTVLKHCDSEWRSMVLFGMYTGQRLGDIARLQWESIDLKRKTLSLTTSKTDKELKLPLHKDLFTHLQSLPRPISQDMPIHPDAYATIKAEGRVSTLSRRFGAILADAGLREKKTHKTTGKGRDAKKDLTGLSFHSLRRTAATLLNEAGVPQAVAMAFVGHDSEDIHKVYVNVGESAMRDAATKIPSVL